MSKQGRTVVDCPVVCVGIALPTRSASLYPASNRSTHLVVGEVQLDPRRVRERILSSSLISCLLWLRRTKDPHCCSDKQEQEHRTPHRCCQPGYSHSSTRPHSHRSQIPIPAQRHQCPSLSLLSKTYRAARVGSRAQGCPTAGSSRNRP